MKPKNFLQALSIVSKNHSNTVIINKSTGNGSTTGSEANPTLHIVNCTGTAHNNLVDAGFSLSMHNGSMVVDDYKMA